MKFENIYTKYAFYYLVVVDFEDSFPSRSYYGDSLRGVFNSIVLSLVFNSGKPSSIHLLVFEGKELYSLLVRSAQFSSLQSFKIFVNTVLNESEEA